MQVRRQWKKISSREKRKNDTHREDLGEIWACGMLQAVECERERENERERHTQLGEILRQYPLLRRKSPSMAQKQQKLWFQFPFHAAGIPPGRKST
jgi:hypothetical protein